MRATIAPVVTVLALVGVVLVLFTAAVLATRGGPVLADAAPDAADLALPPGPLRPEDLSSVRFDMALRGYRMSEVDEVLERLAADLRARDERIAALEQASHSAFEDRPQDRRSSDGRAAAEHGDPAVDQQEVAKVEVDQQEVAKVEVPGPEVAGSEVAGQEVAKVEVAGRQTAHPAG